jgi:hypothetical protein
VGPSPIFSDHACSRWDRCGELPLRSLLPARFGLTDTAMSRQSNPERDTSRIQNLKTSKKTSSLVIRLCSGAAEDHHALSKDIGINRVNIYRFVCEIQKRNYHRVPTLTRFSNDVTEECKTRHGASRGIPSSLPSIPNTK